MNKKIPAKTIGGVDQLPWEEIMKIVNGKSWSKDFNKIPEETYIFAADKQNRDFVIKSALKSLKKTDPASATLEKAETIADMMQIFAKMVLEELTSIRSRK